MDHAIINEYNNLSFEGKITFLEKIDKLKLIGIERFIVDLVGLRVFYFTKSGETYCTNIMLSIIEIIDNLNVAEVQQAIQDTHLKKIDNITFLLTIMKAGCCHYEVYITGKKIFYFGRNGEYYIEPFAN